MAVLVKIDSRVEWEGGKEGWVKSFEENPDFVTYDGYFSKPPGMPAFGKVEYSKTYSESHQLSKISWAKDNEFFYNGYVFVKVDSVWYPWDPDDDPGGGWDWELGEKDLSPIVPVGTLFSVRLHLKESF